MTDDQLQARIRDEVARQLRGAVDRTTHGTAPGPATTSTAPQPAAWEAAEHPSHVRFALPPADDGTCIIQPVVRCTHCGYCKSFGH